ncbi:twin-arginine translocase TatA/TatE family subunit [Methanosarcina sp. MSH10X1]|uniref:Sec-independent protein translocase subunit TatA/TatB n=1 Tax=Methanosarcina sp. MSH10X1 TaxID=2507075 RepID=UPI000FFB40D6|nr:twin-arginine translocase TatA/TatE family subunit [Methanosarcina sp. MSH10X1]RXA19938.1 twin-arginine translocase TatA/TatE family subunit [Methanosarcina sp. MSH10X1]
MIGTAELIAIIVAALFLFGPQKLPELARSLGGAMGEFKKAQRAAELELNQFDAYTRKAANTATSGEKEKEKEQKDTAGSSKEINTDKGLKADTDLNNSADSKPEASLENKQETGKTISGQEEPRKN